MRSIVIIDDHKALLLGIKGYLEEAGFTVAETFDSLEDAGDFFSRCLPAQEPAGEGAPCDDFFIALCDLRFGKQFSFELIKDLSGKNVRCIVYSMYESHYYMLKAFEAGAWGYCFKSGDLANLRNAILSVSGGERYYSGGITSGLLNSTSFFSGFTKKEREIADLIMQGKSNSEIAGYMGITYRTVESYLQRLYSKMNVRSRFELERVLCER